MDRQKKLAMIRRSLGIKHKLRVYDSVALSGSHEEIAQLQVARWELEDELRALEEVLSQCREENVRTFAQRILSQKKSTSLDRADLPLGLNVSV